MAKKYPILNTEAYYNELDTFMKEKNPAAVALGSLKSNKKANSSRENGKKGGRPKKHENNNNTLTT